MRTLNLRLFGAAAIAVAVLSPAYSFVRQALGRDAHLEAAFLCTAILAAIVLGGYQIFFLAQYLARRTPARVLSSRLDGAIPFWPAWVWVYSGLYYAFLGLPIAFMASERDCLTFIASGVGLFFLVTLVHVAVPTRCPSEWRQYAVAGPSARFLAAVQYYDIGLSCFPSLHCAFAAYVAATLPVGALALFVILAVSLSCVFVKQHSVLDVPLSLLLGWVWWMGVHAVLK